MLPVRIMNLKNLTRLRVISLLENLTTRSAGLHLRPSTVVTYIEGNIASSHYYRNIQLWLPVGYTLESNILKEVKTDYFCLHEVTSRFCLHFHHFLCQV